MQMQEIEFVGGPRDGEIIAADLTAEVVSKDDVLFGAVVAAEVLEFVWSPETAMYHWHPYPGRPGLCIEVTRGDER